MLYLYNDELINKASLAECILLFEYIQKYDKF